MEVSVDYCPYSTRVIGSIVCCYILHEYFFGIIAQDMEMSVYVCSIHPYSY